MPNANEDLVKRAYDACKDGDADRLRGIFVYDNSVQIKGVFPAAEDLYPAGQDAKFWYENPRDQGDGKVRTRIRWRPDPDNGSGEYEADVTDTVRNGKISSSSVTWVGHGYRDGTDTDADWYRGKAGWWGWPFGRRR